MIAETHLGFAPNNVGFACDNEELKQQFSSVESQLTAIDAKRIPDDEFEWLHIHSVHLVKTSKNRVQLGHVLQVVVLSLTLDCHDLSCEG